MICLVISVFNCPIILLLCKSLIVQLKDRYNHNYQSPFLSNSFPLLNLFRLLSFNSEGLNMQGALTMKFKPRSSDLVGTCFAAISWMLMQQIIASKWYNTYTKEYKYHVNTVTNSIHHKTNMLWSWVSGPTLTAWPSNELTLYSRLFGLLSVVLGICFLPRAFVITVICARNVPPS